MNVSTQSAHNILYIFFFMCYSLFTIKWHNPMVPLYLMKELYFHLNLNKPFSRSGMCVQLELMTDITMVMFLYDVFIATMIKVMFTVNIL